MDYKLRKAEPRDVSDILRLVKVDDRDDHKPVNSIGSSSYQI